MEDSNRQHLKALSEAKLSVEEISNELSVLVSRAEKLCKQLHIPFLGDDTLLLAACGGDEGGREEGAPEPAPLVKLKTLKQEIEKLRQRLLEVRRQRRVVLHALRLPEIEDDATGFEVNAVPQLRVLDIIAWTPQARASGDLSRLSAALHAIIEPSLGVRICTSNSDVAAIIDRAHASSGSRISRQLQHQHQHQHQDMRIWPLQQLAPAPSTPQNRVKEYHLEGEGLLMCS